MALGAGCSQKGFRIGGRDNDEGGNTPLKIEKAKQVDVMEVKTESRVRG